MAIVIWTPWSVFRVPTENLINPHPLLLPLKSHTMETYRGYRNGTGGAESLYQSGLAGSYGLPISPCSAPGSLTSLIGRDLRGDSDYLLTGDLAEFVFAGQMYDHELHAQHLTGLLAAREGMTTTHIEELDRQIEDLKAKIPLRLHGPGAPYVPPVTDVEKQIMNLERQKRTLEIGHWRDTHELQTALLERQVERQAAARRLTYVGGGHLAGN